MCDCSLALYMCDDTYMVLKVGKQEQYNQPVGDRSDLDVSCQGGGQKRELPPGDDVVETTHLLVHRPRSLALLIIILNVI